MMVQDQITKFWKQEWNDRRVHVNFCKIDIGKIIESMLCFL